MNYRELVPVGTLGQRIRKLLVAGSFLAFVCILEQLVSDPAWAGWWDAYNWRQLFLGGPLLFFSGAVVWQLIFSIVELSHGKARSTGSYDPETFPQNAQKTLKFWLRDSLRISLLCAATCAIGDIPMAVNYLADVLGHPLHWWWSSAVSCCLLVMISIWWVLERLQKPKRIDTT